MAVELKPVETRVSEDTHRKLAEIAKDNHRSIAAELRMIVERHVSEQEAKAA